uniref:G-protein coupled receptors family 1 profile domain-containing protein n=1 Tax=Arion vulgaris TaxID=1028688 RepID=A0A0B6Z9Z8_9EUPU
MVLEYAIETTTKEPTTDDGGGFTAQVIGGIALTSWTLFANLVLILAILRSEHRRKVSFNLHVCNLCVADLLMGVLVLPLYIDFNFHNQWVHSDTLCRIWTMADMMVNTVSILILATMIFDRFVLFSCPDAAEGCCKFVLSSSLIVIPWVFGAVIVIPVYLIGETGVGVKEDDGLCFYNLSTTFAIVAEIACYAVPSLVTFALLVATSMIWCFKKEELRDMDFSDEREHKGWQVLTSWIISLSVLGMWFPFFALDILALMLDRRWPTEWVTGAIWLAYANSGLNPILWMIMPRLRQSVKALCCCCCKRNNYDEDDYLDDETSAAMIEFSEK